MNRMEKIFGKMMEESDKILVTYFPIGDTILNDNVEWAGKYFENGSTLLEIGLPYEDPVLDGETIRSSMERARGNIDLDQVFAEIKKIRAEYPENILQIMTYYENVEKYGVDKFAELCHDCDVDAVLSPNIPQEKMYLMDEALEEKYNIHNLRFAPYNLTEEVIEDLKKNAHGYVFLQAVDGVTGPRENVSPQVGKNVKKLKEAGITTPVVAGFGISNLSQINEVVKMGADGAIVGSAIVSNIEKGTGPEFIKSLEEAMK